MWSSYLTYSFCMVSIVLPFLVLLLYLWFLVLHWIKMERVGVLFLTLVLGEMLSVFFFISNKFGCRFLIHSLYCVKYIPSSSVLSRHFIRKGYWILITVFFISIYLIMWFLMSSLFVYHKYISDTCIELLSLQMPEVLIYCSTSGYINCPSMYHNFVHTDSLSSTRYYILALGIDDVLH